MACLYELFCDNINKVFINGTLHHMNTSMLVIRLLHS